MKEDWERQTIRMTSQTACGLIYQVLHRTDFNNKSIADIAYEILRALGFDVA